MNAYYAFPCICLGPVFWQCPEVSQFINELPSCSQKLYQLHAML